MKLTPESITPCIQVCNEDYWIFYTLKDLYEIFPQIIVLDTGSDDSTKSIIKDYYPKIQLIEECYGHDNHKIGNGRNVLRDSCQTHWMMIVDSDELWPKRNLLKIFDQEVGDTIGVIMLGLANVEDIDGKLMLRSNDYSNRDALFSPDIKWTRTDYPFESYGLAGGFPWERVHYLNAHEYYAYHLRHTVRSSRNGAVYFRQEKYNYFPYQGPWEELPIDWLGEINFDLPNPYLFQTAQARQS